MSKKYFLIAISFVFLFSSCMSINTTKEKIGIQDTFVIFSFDDGPDEHTTPLLLDVLAKHNIKALFCLLGVNARQYPELVKRIHEEGHLFINHGFYDKWAEKMNDEEFKTNLKLGEEAIRGALGFYPQPKLYRPHGGFYNSKHEKIIAEEGWTIVPATIRVYDAVSDSSERKKIVKQTIDITVKKNGGLILLHDAREGYMRKEENLIKKPDGPFNRLWIVQSADEIITALLNKGFILHHDDILKAIGFEAEQK